jgi:hypothetical protein
VGHWPLDFQHMSIPAVQDIYGYSFKVDFHVKDVKVKAEHLSQMFPSEDMTDTGKIFTYRYTDHSEEQKDNDQNVYHHCLYLRGYNKETKELIGHNSFGQINPIVKVKVEKDVRFFEVFVLAIRGNDQFPYFWINRE